MFKSYDDPARAPKASKVVLLVASISSLMWILAALYASRELACTVDAQGLRSCLRLNEWGQFIAGAVGPLMFAWLVIAVSLQSTELREQRRELVLARRECEQNRDVLSEHTSYIGVQTRLLLEAEKNEEFRAKLAVLRQWTLTACRQRVWSAKKTWDDGYLTKDLPTGSIDFLVELSIRLKRAQQDYATGGLNGSWDKLTASNPDVLRELIDRIAHLLETVPDLGPAMRRVVEDAAIEELIPELRASLEEQPERTFRYSGAAS